MIYTILKNYVILLPTGRHTQIVSKIIQNIISNKEATLSRMEFYKNTDYLLIFGDDDKEKY